MKLARIFVIATLLWVPLVAQSALTIQITQGVEGAAPIAVIPFAQTPGVAKPPQDIAQIIADNLQRSGRLAPIEERNLIARPAEASQVRFADWRTLGAESLVIGKTETLANGSYRIQFRLFDVLRGRQIAGYSFPATADKLRVVAHRISDIIYQKLTGQPGAFATRVAYILSNEGEKGKEYQLQLADSDGHNPTTLLTSAEPLMSPAWSADGSQLAYVSFEKRRATVFVQDIASGQRKSVATFPGLNGAPSWSPDGRKLALTLSRDGNPEIYSLRIKDGKLTRLTNSSAIDTEAAWSPDGKTIIFTSDRGGSPQLYRMASSGGRASRLTFEGNYNASADFAPDGKTLALVHAESGRYQIASLDLKTKLLRILSDGKLDESPSYAPNGSMIIYATQSSHQGELAAVSSDGRIRQRLSLRHGDVREPVWSPMEKR